MILFRAEHWGWEEGFEVWIEQREDGTLIFHRQGTLMLAGGEHWESEEVSEEEALTIMADFSDCEVSPCQE